VPARYRAEAAGCAHESDMAHAVVKVNEIPVTNDEEFAKNADAGVTDEVPGFVTRARRQGGPARA
jgi:hypothetical protein